MLRSRLSKLCKKAIRRGVSPWWIGYRWVARETVPEYLERKDRAQYWRSYETVHPREVAQNPLPCNVETRNELPRDRGWWGFSFWDVPERTSRETFTATLPDCRVIPYIDPNDGEFWVAFLNEDERSLELDQISYRPWHGEVLRAAREVDHLKHATWILERVYRNHSHWLTAHLPKLLLLKERGELDDVILPPKDARTSVMTDSLQMLGIDPDTFRTFDVTRPLKVEQLTVLETDRFRPELLQPVRDALCTSSSEAPKRKIYISRAKASRRQLVNEKDIWTRLEKKGFEKVFMEELDFATQVGLMQQAAVVVAPHGAGLTNMMFCPVGTHVVEIADLSFPNPNFYALASAMGHHYWILEAEGLGDVHPLEKDLRIAPSIVSETIDRIAAHPTRRTGQ